MKAEELMVGDWVIFKAETPKMCKVVSIDTDYGNYIRQSLTDTYYTEEYFEPIPLTAEILKKNGFELAEPYGKYKWSDRYTEIWVIMGDLNGLGESRNVVHIDDWKDGIPVCYHNIIEYAHELQHAMRICGIYMDFKV